MSHDDAEAMAAALVAVGDPAIWLTLQVEHVGDNYGQCRTCRDTARGTAQPWPCALRLLADTAARLHHARSSGAPPAGRSPSERRALNTTPQPRSSHMT